MTKKESKFKLNCLYINYIENGKESSFSELSNNLYYILKAKYGSNLIFRIRFFPYTFDDVFQLTLVKLFRFKDKFDNKKGNVVTWSYTIFRNTLLDLNRQHTRYKEKMDMYKLLNPIDIFEEEVETYI